MRIRVDKDKFSFGSFTAEGEKFGAIADSERFIFRSAGATGNGWRRENRKTIQVAKKERVRDRGEERARRRSANGPRTHQGRE